MLTVPGALEFPARSRWPRKAAISPATSHRSSDPRRDYHFAIVAGESARGLMALTMDGVAIGNGILTVEKRGAAVVRADPAQKDKAAKRRKPRLPCSRSRKVHAMTEHAFMAEFRWSWAASVRLSRRAKRLLPCSTASTNPAAEIDTADVYFGRGSRPQGRRIRNRHRRMAGQPQRARRDAHPHQDGDARCRGTVRARSRIALARCLSRAPAQPIGSISITRTRIIPSCPSARSSMPSTARCGPARLSRSARRTSTPSA